MAELEVVRSTLKRSKYKLLRDVALKQRLRTFAETWVATVRPRVGLSVGENKLVFKASNELDRILQLTVKNKPIAEYNKRLNNLKQICEKIDVESITLINSELRTDLSKRFVEGIPDLPTSLVPPSVLGWKGMIEKFLSNYPFDKSVFIMVRYRDKNDALLNSIKTCLRNLNLNAILAKEHRLTDDLYNPVACLLCCSKGIAIFDEAEMEQKFNPNVAYELGMMHLLGRDCLLLKNQSLQSLNTDILMKLYQDYNDSKDAVEKVKLWISGPNSGII